MNFNPIFFYRSILTVLCLISALVGGIAQSQPPSVFHYNLQGQGNEQDPLVYTKVGDGYFISYRITKSNPDSAFCGIAHITNGLDPVWNRVIKLQANAFLNGLWPEADGGVSFFVNGYTILNRYSVAWLRLDNQGNVQQRIQLLDSANLVNGSAASYQIRLSNGNRIVVAGSGNKVFRIQPSGFIDFARSFSFSTPTKPVIISKLLASPQNNEWYALGQVSNSSQGILMRFQDTVLVSNRIYSGLTPGYSGYIRDAEVLDNGDLQILGSEGITLIRTNPSGIPIWSKFHKITGSFPQAFDVLDNGIWVTGSLSAGQAGALVARFSLTGNYLNHTGQFKLGFSHSPIRSMVQLNGGQVLSIQKAFYNNTNVLLANQVSTGDDFVCFDYIAGTMSDTSYLVTDSSTSLIRKKVERFGSLTNPPLLIQVLNQTLERGPVSCTSTPVAPEFGASSLEIFPTPATDRLFLKGIAYPQPMHMYDLQGKLHLNIFTQESIELPRLPPGMYLLEIPSMKRWQKVFIADY